MFKKKNIILLLLAILIAFSPITYAKKHEEPNSYSIEIQSDKDYVFQKHYFPLPIQKIEPEVEAYIKEFSTEETEPSKIIKDIMRYMNAYKVSYDLSLDSPLGLKDKKGTCYHFTLFASKLLENTDLPYKIAMYVAVDKNGDPIKSHTAIVINNNNSPFIFETTYTATIFNKIYLKDLDLDILFNAMADTDSRNRIIKNQIFLDDTKEIQVYITEWLNSDIKTKDKTKPIKVEKRYMDTKTGYIEYFD